jgi:anti-anti-sigma factor
VTERDANWIPRQLGLPVSHGANMGAMLLDDLGARGLAPQHAEAALLDAAMNELRDETKSDTQRDLVRSGRMTIQVHTEDDLYVVSLVGELDISSTQGLGAELLRAEESSASRIVLDLSGVEFIDSSGLELLVMAKRRSDADADRLRIRPGRDLVTRLLALTKIDEFLHFEE